MFDIKVTGLGTCTRTEKSGLSFTGIAHINHKRKGNLAILWYDNQQKIHYWNQNKCNKFESGKCEYGTHCKYSHIDSTIIAQLKAKYATYSPSNFISISLK